MPNRGLDNPEMLRTEVTANTSGAQTAEGIAQFGVNIIKSEQDSLMTKNFSQAQMELNASKAEFQSQYKDKPFDGLNEWTSKRNEVLQNYGDQISPFFRGTWNRQTREFGVRDDALMETWAYRQAAENTSKNLATTMKQDYLQANKDGQAYGNGQLDDVTALANYGMRQQNLQEGAQKTLGTEKTTGMLNNYTSDSTKMFVAGVASTNPQKAGELINSEAFAQHFTTQQLGEMADLIEKTQKQTDLRKSLRNTVNTQDVTDLVNDPNTSFADKRLTIDQLELTGSLPAQTAANARRVLTAKNSVDAVTSTPVISDLIERVYDLNAQQGLGAGDYMTGIQNIHNEILQQQAAGKLNVNDVTKLNNEIKTLTANKLAQSTQQVGSSLYDASQQFNTLPPEWRGEATRELFYMTNGQSQNLSGAAYKNLLQNSAQQVMRNINERRRQQAVKTLHAPSPQDEQQLEQNMQQREAGNDWLAKKGITLQQVQETAKNRGMSEDAVIQKLRQKLGD